VTVPYFRCADCGFLFTTFCDDWSHEDFGRLIYNDDYVLVDPEYVSNRPIRTAERMAHWLRGYEAARILDYGAGRGLFAERLAELGYANVESYDPFTIPKRPEGRFDIVTCFEVIEHSTAPANILADLRSFLADQGCIVLAEAVQPLDIEHLRGSWWYVAPRCGHVSTFADRTLVALADRHGMVYHRGDPHALVRGSSFAELGGRFGLPLACFRLVAPGQEREGEWHGVEPDRRGQFQWTASETVTWRMTTPPGPPRLLQIMLPFLHEARAGFAADCRIRIDGITIATAVRESCIFAESTTVMRGDVTVTLSTPPLASADNRRVGLAIKVPATTVAAGRAGDR